MSAISWVQALTLALAAFFIVGFVINTYAVKLVGPEYRRWGCPDWFHFVSGGLDLMVALLLAAEVTRPFGVGLGCGVMLAATVIYHREYPRAAPPFVVFARLSIIGATMIQDHRHRRTQTVTTKQVARRPHAGASPSVLIRSLQQISRQGRGQPLRFRGRQCVDLRLPRP